MKVAVGLRRVAAGKRTSGRRAAQIAIGYADAAAIYQMAVSFEHTAPKIVVRSIYYLIRLTFDLLINRYIIFAPAFCLCGTRKD